MTVSSPDRPAAPLLTGPVDPAHLLRALRAERSRVTHWRRLVRARMDLAVAALVLPEALGPDADVPDLLALVDAVSAGGPQGELDRLESLRDLDARLARHAQGVDQAIEAARGGMGQTVPRT
ncbi:hypothetical protein [Cellulomonas sp. ATA003]|uniref:hypothetical protein n=1 Tax=Cellulomonas sp. ATA003 TaxID=3073064 RepID=UPI002872F962|nr:hypothetical protein [Cellulomonas sp. ATA003]WNB85887.1 hypothetical protein REH70_00675 [Cellulomonas sp. ATA003]